MSNRKRRSARSGRPRLSSPGRPPVAGRDERRRFWAGIATGLASEDAAIGAAVPQAVGTRWFRKAGGMPPAMFGSSAKPLSGEICRFRNGKSFRSCVRRARAYGRSPGRWDGRRRRSRGSCDATPRRAAVAWTIGRPRRNGMPNGPPEACEAGGQRGAADVCAGSIGWRGCHAKWGCGSRADGVLERSPTRTSAGSAVGLGLEPGADCPSLMARVPAR